MNFCFLSMRNEIQLLNGNETVQHQLHEAGKVLFLLSYQTCFQVSLQNMNITRKMRNL